MATDRIAERRRVYKQYKADVQERGKPFYPYAMLHDTIMSLVVVSVIIGLAIVWKWTTPGDHTGTGAAGWQDARRPRRLGHDQLRSAAGLVLLLPLLPPADLQVAGDRVPRHDRRADAVPHAAAGDPVPRRPSRAQDPAAAGRADRPRPRRRLDGLLTYKGATAKEALGSEIVGKVRPGRRRRASPATRLHSPAGALRGLRLPELSHLPERRRHNLGAPELAAEGAKNKGIASRSRT